MSKTLIAYFSASNVTKKLAEELADIVKGDLFEIKPAIPYSKADLDWTNSSSRSTLEMKDPSSRPAIEEKLDNMAQYDTVFVGFPIWWYVAPTIINTFLESYDFSGKTIIPFATSGGSGVGKTDEMLHALLPSSVSWKPCAVLNHASHNKLAAWVDGLSL